MACLSELITILKAFEHVGGTIPATLSEEAPLHGCVLAGNAGGKLGYIVHTYWIRGGRVVNDPIEYWGGERMWYSTAYSRIKHLADDPTTWTDGPIKVVRRFLATHRQNPRCGGPDDS